MPAIDRVRGWLGGDLRAPAALFVGALVARVIVVAASPDYAPVYDSADYDRHAEALVAGQGFPATAFGIDGGATAFRPPLYPLLLSVVYGVTDARLTPARLVGAGLGAIVVVLIYLIASRIWGRRVGLVAGALAAVFGPLVITNASIQSESLFLPLELGSVLAVLAFRRSGALRFAALAGVLCALGALTRSNGVLFLIPIMVGVWGSPRVQWRSLAAPALAVGCTVLVIAPWTLRNAQALDAFVPITTQTGFALAGTYNDESRSGERYPASWRLPQQTRQYGPLYKRKDFNEAELDSEVRSQAVDYALEHPGYVAETVWYQTLRILSLAPEDPVGLDADRVQQGIGHTVSDVVRWTFYLSALLAIAGAVVLLRRPRGDRGPGFIWLYPLFAILGAVAILGSTRYRVPAYPFLIFLDAIALCALAERLGWWRSRAPAGS